MLENNKYFLVLRTHLLSRKFFSCFLLNKNTINRHKVAFL